MGYGARGLNDLRDEAFETSRSKGFHEKAKSVGEDIALIHSELSEALEDFRHGHAPSESWLEEGKPCGIPSEMADVIIRVLDFCGNHGIDIEQAVREKMLFNESRTRMHGGKKL